ncbi:hemagglutinin protein, partial [Bacillus paralicheniformis]|nr:hemagglutinin protein [Bacillus paralicheniformis]
GVTPAAQAAPQLTAKFTQTSVWDTGYGATYTIANSGDTPSTTWTVEFDLPAGSTVSNSWSSTRTQTGQHYKFTNAAHNGDIAPGATESFGFNVSGLGTP